MRVFHSSLSPHELKTSQASPESYEVICLEAEKPVAAVNNDRNENLCVKPVWKEWHGKRVCWRVSSP